MKHFLIGTLSTEGATHFIAPFKVVSASSAREACRIYLASTNQEGEVMCIFDKKGHMSHVSEYTDESECLSASNESSTSNE